MRRRYTSGGFFFSLFFNILLNYELAIPGILVFIARIWFPIPLWVAFAVLSIWIVIPLITTLLLTLMSGLASKEEEAQGLEYHQKQYDKHVESENMLAAFNEKKRQEREKKKNF